MAVRKNDRNRGNDGKLQVIEYVKNLAMYTHDRVKSDIFPKNERWLTAKNIWDMCVGAHTSIIRANAIRVECREDAEKRLHLEKEAIGYLDAMISLIDIIHQLKMISDDRCDFWTKLATDTQNLTKAWLKANRKEYKPFMDQTEQQD